METEIKANRFNVSLAERNDGTFWAYVEAYLADGTWSESDAILPSLINAFDWIDAIIQRADELTWEVSRFDGCVHMDASAERSSDWLLFGALVNAAAVE